MKVLHLTLKKKWFDMIASGKKKEEYRDKKDYWLARLMDFDIVSRNSFSSFRKPTGFKHFDIVCFKNGYPKKYLEGSSSFSIKCEGISLGPGKPEWGAEPGKEYFVIKLGEIIKGESKTLKL